MPVYDERCRMQVLGVAQQFPTTVTFGQIDHIYEVGLQRARARGLRADNAEDTSQEFGGSWLLDLKADKPWAKRCLVSEPYLFSCADKHALTALTRIQYRYNQEREWLDSADDEWVAELENHPCEEIGPEKQAIRRELWVAFDWAISQLNPRSQAIYRRRKIDQESVISIADDFGCTPNAISLSLNTSRHQVLAHLAVLGLTEEVIREYLYEIYLPD
jgi:DNA-directed RNA polymerase specialized sigma24 family protein